MATHLTVCWIQCYASLESLVQWRQLTAAHQAMTATEQAACDEVVLYVLQRSWNKWRHQYKQAFADVHVWQWRWNQAEQASEKCDTYIELLQKRKVGSAMQRWRGVVRRATHLGGWRGLGSARAVVQAMWSWRKEYKQCEAYSRAQVVWNTFTLTTALVHTFKMITGDRCCLLQVMWQQQYKASKLRIQTQLTIWQQTQKLVVARASHRWRLGSRAHSDCSEKV